MFRFKESLSGQLLNHVSGTSTESAHLMHIKHGSITGLMMTP